MPGAVRWRVPVLWPARMNGSMNPVELPDGEHVPDNDGNRMCNGDEGFHGPPRAPSLRYLAPKYVLCDLQMASTTMPRAPLR
jgi:hypothetical protein